jgi:hypothetical protein
MPGQEKPCREAHQDNPNRQNHPSLPATGQPPPPNASLGWKPDLFFEVLCHFFDTFWIQNPLIVIFGNASGYFGIRLMVLL